MEKIDSFMQKNFSVLVVYEVFFEKKDFKESLIRYAFSVIKSAISGL
jgi:hypothetical protein